MKNNSEYASRLRRLISRIQRSLGSQPGYTSQGPLNELVLACLTERSSESKARHIFTVLEGQFVDFNEMRVCREIELADILGGAGAADAKTTARKILTLLRQVFDRWDSLGTEIFQLKSKKEIKDFLGSLEEITPYITARMTLCGFESHAIPVNEAMLAMLRHEQVVDAEANVEEVQAFLERHIAAKGAIKTFMQLQRFCEVYQQEPAAETEPKKKTVKAKKTTKKK